MNKTAGCLFILTLLKSSPFAYTPNDPKIVVEPSTVVNHALNNIAPSAHGAVYIATPYDTSLSASLLEKMKIPPQFNGIKNYSNPNDATLPIQLIIPTKSTTPNPSFSRTVEDYNIPKKRTLKKGKLKDSES